MKILNVAEKPSMAKSITQSLADSFSRRPGMNKYCLNYDFTYARVSDGKRIVNMTMTSVLGHVMNYQFPEEFTSWQAVPYVELLGAPVVKVVTDNCKGIKSNLEREARNSDWLVIWTDCDREGENIGYEVMEICRAANPRIDVYRARFSVVNARELKRAFENLQRLDMNQAFAVDARQQLDLKIGAAFTRLQTISLRDRFSSFVAEKKIVSYGSCQFPTLGFIVEQYWRSINFIPENFWGMNLTMKMDNDSFQFGWSRGVIFDEGVCSAFHFIVCNAGAAKVVSVDKKPTSKYRPLPLTTVEFQKFGSRYLKISSHKLMTIAESLYNRGIISYPRTETDVFEKAFNLKSMIQLQAESPEWGAYSQRLLDGEFKYPRNGKRNDESHPPIHPTACPKDLKGEEKKVFDFVARRFLACCSDDARGQATHIKVELGDEIFSIQGVIITERNYLEVYTYDKWVSTIVPDLNLGDTFQPASIEMYTGLTTAPPLLSEADLIGTMDKNGIGTDATIHEHIKKVLDREYAIKLKDQHLKPTPLGLSLVEGFDSFGFENSLTKPHLRAKTEIDMKLICDGRKRMQDFLDENLALYRSILLETQSKINILIDAVAKNINERPSDESLTAANGSANNDSGEQYLVGPCHLCNSMMKIKACKDGSQIFIGCSKYPRCKGSIWFKEELLDSVCATDMKCSNCTSESYLINFELANGGGESSMCISCDERAKEFITKSRNDADNPMCKCGISSRSGVTRKEGANNGRTFYSCSKGRNEGCDFFEWQDESNKQTHPQAVPNNQPEVHATHHQPRQSHEHILAAEEAAPNCKCHLPSKLVQTKKQGANFGRFFYTCSKGRDGGCDYFQWQDEPYSNPVIPQQQENIVASDEIAPNCNCRVPSKLVKTKKQGANFGRFFYTCSKGRDGGCDYFQWQDEAAEADTASGMRRTGSMNDQSRSGSFGESSISSSDITCICGQPSVVKVVQKSSENQGRQFLCCAKARNGCSFFQWLDEAQRKNSENQENRSLKCDCGFTAKSGTCRKAPNEGRNFFSCPQSSYGKCKFFQWADEEDYNQDRGDGYASKTGNNFKSNSSCFNCNQVGHYASQCPNASNGSNDGKGKRKSASSSSSKGSKRQTYRY